MDKSRLDEGLFDPRRLATVAQLAEETAITEGGWRWLLFHRQENGLDRAVLRLGRRLFLDREEVARWLESRRERPAA